MPPVRLLARIKRGKARQHPLVYAQRAASATLRAMNFLAAMGSSLSASSCGRPLTRSVGNRTPPDGHDAGASDLWIVTPNEKGPPIGGHETVCSG